MNNDLLLNTINVLLNLSNELVINKYESLIVILKPFFFILIEIISPSLIIGSII